MTQPRSNVPWKAGAAHVVANPPAGVDLVGYLRRWRSSQGNGQALEVNALVTESESKRLAIIALDAPSVVGAYATRMREAVAEAIGCGRESVLVNASHTHCAPPLPGHLKTGGSTADLTDAELEFAETLITAARNAATIAAGRLTDCRVGFTKRPFPGGVNRRQRTADGSTIMGWNPDGPTDPDLSVVRIESTTGTPVCAVVSYSCHPTVLGPDVLNSSSDFVGPLRDEVRAIVGGECLFLQGTAGNIFPLEAVHGAEGPEVDFGHRMAHVATCAYDDAWPVALHPVETPYKSAVDVAIWRLEPRADQPVLHNDAVELAVELPLMDVPSPAKMRVLHDELQARLNELKESGADRDVWNATWLHTLWAARMLARLETGPEPVVASTVSALMLGRVLVIALPCEPFCELGLAIKQRFADVPVLVAGYSNDMVGYVATAAEYPFGGYEPWLAPRHFDQPAPFATTTADILVAAAIAAGEQVLDRIDKDDS
ncbi:hypothetical protein PWY87_33070 [Kribbella solani]|uniref:hypothetical protein n=1 Tax=Kribbella solani TaxID=236067 RepID=UPI0029AB5E53|nr:hypothetical protein [Kribbella solani]MDX3006555.1 hypothetical protein [Kribbella solani]